MATVQQRVEHYIGLSLAAYSDELAQVLDDSVKEVIGLLPLDSLTTLWEELTDSGSGVNTSNKFIVEVRKNLYRAQQISPSQRTTDAASSTQPLYYSWQGSTYVIPSGGTVLVVTPPSIDPSDTTVANVPDSLMQLFVLRTAFNMLAVLAAQDRNDVVTAITATQSIPNAPDAPEITFGSVDAGTASGSAVTAGSAAFSTDATDNWATDFDSLDAEFPAESEYAPVTILNTDGSDYLSTLGDVFKADSVDYTDIRAAAKFLYDTASSEFKLQLDDQTGSSTTDAPVPSISNIAETIPDIPQLFGGEAYDAAEDPQDPDGSLTTSDLAYGFSPQWWATGEMDAYLNAEDPEMVQAFAVKYRSMLEQRAQYVEERAKQFEASMAEWQLRANETLAKAVGRQYESFMAAANQTVQRYSQEVSALVSQSQANTQRMLGILQADNSIRKDKFSAYLDRARILYQSRLEYYQQRLQLNISNASEVTQASAATVQAAVQVSVANANLTTDVNRIKAEGDFQAKVADYQQELSLYNSKVQTYMQEVATLAQEQASENQAIRAKIGMIDNDRERLSRQYEVAVRSYRKQYTHRRPMTAWAHDY